MRLTIRVFTALALGFNGSGCLWHHSPSGGSMGLDSRTETMGTPGTPSNTELQPKQSAALSFTMAMDLEKKGDEASAIGYYERARELDPALNERASRRLAILYDKCDNQAKALTAFQELLKKKPKDSALLSDLGYSYYNRGQWADAETYLKRAVAADKTNKRAWNNLGLALAQQGKIKDSLEAFAKVGSPAEAHANVGFVLATQQKRDQAMAEYRVALQLEPMLKTAQAAMAKLEAPPAPIAPPATAGVQSSGGSTGS